MAKAGVCSIWLFHILLESPQKGDLYKSKTFVLGHPKIEQKYMFIKYGSVCVSVYTLPPVDFFWLHDVCEYQVGAFCEILSSLFPDLSYFTSKDVTPACHKTGGKNSDVMPTFQKKKRYIKIQDIRRPSATLSRYEKTLQIRRLL